MDICYCANASEHCPKAENCLRGTEHGVGIYTISQLWQVCIKDSNYSNYIPITEDRNNAD